MSKSKKVIVITGSANGIGKEIASVFARTGAKVVIADLDINAAQKTSQELVNQGYQAIGIGMDITNEQQVEDGINAVINKWGDIDALISNAGIQHIESIDQLSFNSWKKMMAVHLDGAFLVTKACLKNMYSHNKGGSVIYIGSVHSKEASVLKGPYVTAKHGLIGLSKVVAKEGAKHNVRANVICPGFVKTALVEKQIPLQAKALNISEEEVVKQVLLKETVDNEFTTVADVAEVARFLVDFPSNALTGQSIVVSHGWHMG